MAHAQLLEDATIKPGTETVLIVEDERIVRRVAVRILQKQGYDVLEACDGNEAIDLVQRTKKPIHLLLTDVVMPGMNGRQLAQRLTRLLPKMKVLYMSGYAEDVIITRGIIEPGLAFIEKTFTSASLCKKVREILDCINPKA